MNIGRIGHYYNPGNGSCQTALVVKVVEQAPITSVVNLVIWESDGDDDTHLEVSENTNPLPTDTEASFHLSSNCPYGR